MAGCVAIAAAGGNVFDAGVGLKLEGTDGGVESCEGCGCAVHGRAACDVDLGLRCGGGGSRCGGASGGGL